MTLEVMVAGVSALVFTGALYCTCDLLEFWFNKKPAPLLLPGLVAILWGIFAALQGLFLP